MQIFYKKIVISKKYFYAIANRLCAAMSQNGFWHDNIVQRKN
jgi:hypothetical protein